MKRLADLQEAEEEGEGDGTAKQKDLPQAPETPSTSARFTAPSDWRNSIAQNRLSGLFDSWIHTSSSPSSAVGSTPEKKTVSEPRLLQSPEQPVKRSVGSDSRADQSVDADSQEFEEMLVSSCILKGVLYLTSFW